MILWYRYRWGIGEGITWGVFLVPLFVAMCMLAALSVGLWLTALNVKYRDVGQAMPFLIQMWMWLTPVAYPSSMVPPGWRLLYGMNPMTGVIETFRWALFPKAVAPDWGMVGISLA